MYKIYSKIPPAVICKNEKKLYEQLYLHWMITVAMVIIVLDTNQAHPNRVVTKYNTMWTLLLNIVHCGHCY